MRDAMKSMILRSRQYLLGTIKRDLARERGENVGRLSHREALSDALAVAVLTPEGRVVLLNLLRETEYQVCDLAAYAANCDAQHRLSAAYAMKQLDTQASLAASRLMYLLSHGRGRLRTLRRMTPEATEATRKFHEKGREQ